jgi:hypothetical protein
MRTSRNVAVRGFFRGPRREARVIHETRGSQSRQVIGSHDEGGAVLILALVFLIVVGGIVGVIANSVSAHLEDSTKFQSGRTTQYAATSAVDAAIQSIRYSPFLASTLNASPPSQCWNTQQGVPFSPTDPASEEDGVDVWCSTVWTPSASPTRVVTISACQTTVNGSSSLCAIHPLLQAVVNFDDYPAGVSAPNPALCAVYCGGGESIQSWLWSPVVPVVTQISTGAGNTGPITGLTPVTISGTGFVPSSTSVNFIQETGGVPVTTSTLSPIPATVNADGTALTVNSPAVTSGTTYFVTVTTPSGTSPVSSANVFTYLPASTPPRVIGISVGHKTPASGTVNGGDLISIAGSGFFAGAQVAFVPVSTGTTLYATNVTVTSGTAITALSPSILAGTNYFVEVTTAGGTTNPVNNNNDVFQYVLPVPVVSGIAETGATPSVATTGAAGSQLTLSGASFSSGASVHFYPNNSCGGSNPVAGTNVTVSSTSSISVNAPSLSSRFVKNEQYCVAVTTTAGSSSNTISFTPNS